MQVFVPELRNNPAEQLQTVPDMTRLLTQVVQLVLVVQVLQTGMQILTIQAPAERTYPARQLVQALALQVLQPVGQPCPGGSNLCESKQMIEVLDRARGLRQVGWQEE